MILVLQFQMNYIHLNATLIFYTKLLSEELHVRFVAEGFLLEHIRSFYVHVKEML